jgi:hypothetical protein
MKNYYVAEEVIQEILFEVERAGRIHPNWPSDKIHAAGIVCEEAGELMKAALDSHYFGKSKKDIETEAIHTAATAIRLLMNFDKETT